MSVNTKCQVFTPRKNAEQLLDIVGYVKNLYGKKVAENSCGDGSILERIVERYITDCMKKNVSLDFIKKGLENDIWGAEIDKTHILNCKIKLNNIAKKYRIENVSWNIFEGDFLKEKIINTFDFVVGNPPYITYKELANDEREFVRSAFSTCKVGKFDYCYAFIEASIKSLKKTGRLAYLIPSNIFKNYFAMNLREFILPYLTNIYDYTNLKLFEGKLTASAIVVCDMSSNNNSIVYHDLVRNKEIHIEKKTLVGKWVFNERNDNLILIKRLRFGDYFHAASSVATLLNKVYIISDYIDEVTYIKVKDHKIEKELIRVAKSPRSINYNIKEFIIFPYYYTEQGLQKYDTDEFEKKFPFGVQYLRQFKEKLANRKSDKSIKWYEFGRSQALAHLNQKKILISTLVTRRIKVNCLDEDDIPTSGIYIVSKNRREYCLKKAMNILKSSCFMDYVKNIGVISNGNSYRISSKDINNFNFPIDLLE